MNKSIYYYAAFSLVGIILGACTPTAIPGTLPVPAKSLVSPSDITGEWKQESIELSLYQDFQFVLESSLPEIWTGQGSWKLSATNDLVLRCEENCKCETSCPSWRDDTWYIIVPADSGYSSDKYGALAIFGGADDPDDWRPFERID